MRKSCEDAAIYFCFLFMEDHRVYDRPTSTLITCPPDFRPPIRRGSVRECRSSSCECRCGPLAPGLCGCPNRTPADALRTNGETNDTWPAWTSHLPEPQQ